MKIRVGVILFALLWLTGCPKGNQPIVINTQGCGTGAGYVPCNQQTPDYLTGDKLTAQQHACLAKIPTPHCGPTPQVRIKLEEGERWVDASANNAKMGDTSPEEALTFHNPGVGGANRTVDEVFRDYVFWNASKFPDYYQHAHGRSHSLYVIDRNSGNTATVNLYPLEFGDVIFVYYESLKGTVPDSRVAADITGNGSPQYDQRIELVEKESDIYPSPGCDHTGVPGPYYYWHVTVRQPLNTETFEDDYILGSAATAQYRFHNGIRKYKDISSGKYIRRIAVKTLSNQLRYDVKVSPCGAFQTCARPDGTACADVPLCRIDLENMIASCKDCQMRLTQQEGHSGGGNEAN